MASYIIKTCLRLTNKYSSKPDKQRIWAALSHLLSRILNEEKRKGLVIPFDIATGKFIIFSDMHKGTRSGADDFLVCEPAYLAALDYYQTNGFHFIALGDCEELWENSLTAIKKHNRYLLKKKKFCT